MTIAPAQLAFELDPASPWCQRWADGRQPAWRHTSEGGFDPSRYDVAPIDEAPAKAFVLGRHYSGSYPVSSHRYGLFEAGRLVGVAVLGVPVQALVLTNVFPGLEPYVESLELSRFVLDEDVPANGESYFLGQVFREAAARGLRGIVSFSDPVPRRVAGEVVFPGHVGTIYQATNAVYTGRGSASTLTILPDGFVLNNRACSKVRNGERGHEYIERRLVALGARAPRAGESGAAWLAEAVEAVKPVRIRHRGNHRYAFRLGETKRQRAGVEIAFPGQAYPKVADA